MANLYEIDQAIMACIDMESGEIIDPERLDALQMERTAKLEGVALWIKNLESDAVAYKAEKDAFAAREKAAKRKAESLRAWLAGALQGEKLTTARTAVTFRRSTAVEIPNEDLFVVWAGEYRNDLLTYDTPKINRTAVMNALKGGTQLPGVHIAERQNIQIK